MIVLSPDNRADPLLRFNYGIGQTELAFHVMTLNYLRPFPTSANGAQYDLALTCASTHHQS